MKFVKSVLVLMAGLACSLGAPAEADASDFTRQEVADFATKSQETRLAQRNLPRRCRDILDDMKDDTYAILYIASYPDLAKAFGRDPDRGRKHFSEYGCDEGRDITFDGLIYVAGYSDLIKAIGTNEQKALDHFLKYGAREGRSITKFNAAAYANRYSDLRSKFGNNRRRLAQHCIRYGFKERREFCG